MVISDFILSLMDNEWVFLNAKSLHTLRSDDMNKLTSNHTLKSYIKHQFDDEFDHIIVNNTRVKFSAERILFDLINSGISVLDSLEILSKSHQYLTKGMKIGLLIKILNKLIIEEGYGEQYLIRGEFDPIVIEYPEYEEFLSFKTLRSITQNSLSEYVYSSTTFGLIVDELYRVLHSIKNNRIKVNHIEKIIPSVIRSVIQFDPFDKETSQSLYHKISSLYTTINDEWAYIPDHEQSEYVIEFLETIFNLILCWFNYLPGHNFDSTVSQVNLLVKQQSGNYSLLSDRELHLLGKTASQLNSTLKKGKKANFMDSYNWIKVIHSIMSTVIRFVHQNIIKWIVLVDTYDRELYTYFTRSTKQKYRKLLGMAIGGIHSLMNEVTEDHITSIEQADGRIIIERTSDFRLVVFIKHHGSPLIQSIISELAILIEIDVGEDIRAFDGNISTLERKIDPIVRDHFGLMLEKT